MGSVMVALIGDGRREQRYLKALRSMDGVEVLRCGDPGPAGSNRLVHSTASLDDVLRDAAVAAAIIATPSASHFAIARQALAAGKNVFLPQPCIRSRSEAEELAAIAASGKLFLMAGPNPAYHPAFSWVKEFTDAGKLGRIFYLSFHHAAFGPTRPETNVLWHLAVDDLGILCYLAAAEPARISAHASCCRQPGVHDVLFLTVAYPDDTLAQIQASWVYPLKSQVMTIVGEKGTLVFDALKSENQICIYEHGPLDRSVVFQREGDRKPYHCIREHHVTLPVVSDSEHLHNQCRHFVECIRRQEEPRIDLGDTLMLTIMMEIAQKSIALRGVPLPFSPVALG